MNHYQWLDKYFPTFLNSIGGNFDHCPGIVVAHGDKFYTYKFMWKDAGVPFAHGVAIAFLTYLRPWSEESEKVEIGDWVISVYTRFREKLREAEES